MTKTLLIGTLFMASTVFIMGAGCARTPQDTYSNSAYESGAVQPIESMPIDDGAIKPSTNSNPSTTMTLATNKTYTAVLHTDQGDIEIALAADKTPITAGNFVTLAQKGFYDGTIFHRVIDGFMIQGGDPTGTGAGGPGYKFNDEPFDGEYSRGTVAMANAGPNTNGSQFFIMHAAVPLPKNYVIFGQVTKGLDVVDAIATAPVVTSASGEASKPVKPVVVKTVTVEEKSK